MGREPGDPRGAGLPPAGRRGVTACLRPPWALGGPQGASRAAEDSAYQPASLIPAELLECPGPTRLSPSKGPRPRGARLGEGPRSWRPEEAPGLTSPWQSLGTVSSAGNSGRWCAARAAENCVGSRRQRRGPSAQAPDSGSRRAELPAGLGLRFHPAARLRAAGPPCELPG